MEKSCINKVILAYLLNFCIAKTAEKNECKESKGKKIEHALSAIHVIFLMLKKIIVEAIAPHPRGRENINAQNNFPTSLSPTEK